MSQEMVPWAESNGLSGASPTSNLSDFGETPRGPRQSRKCVSLRTQQVVDADQQGLVGLNHFNLGTSVRCSHYVRWRAPVTIICFLLCGWRRFLIKISVKIHAPNFPATKLSISVYPPLAWKEKTSQLHKSDFCPPMFVGSLSFRRFHKTKDTTPEETCSSPVAVFGVDSRKPLFLNVEKSHQQALQQTLTCCD